MLKSGWFKSNESITENVVTIKGTDTSSGSKKIKNKQNPKSNNF